MIYSYGCRVDRDSNAITVIDEENRTAVTKGTINGVPVEFGSGSSDFSTAEVTFLVDGAYAPMTVMPAYLSDDELVCGYDWLSDNFYLANDTYTVVMYNGSVDIRIFPDSDEDISKTFAYVNPDNVTITFDEDTGTVLLNVIGDCTIVITDQEQ